MIERMGIEVSRDYLERANVVLVCGDSSNALRDARQTVASISKAPIIETRTKADLIPAAPRVASDGQVQVSAETGEGISALVQAIADALRSTAGALPLDAPLITRERHRFALEGARDELRSFADAFSTQAVPAVVAAVHLREATRYLEELIGAVDTEDVLDRLFSSFCVGK
jgi:tRNA modification GTPase